MSLKCSVFGHRFGDPVVERSRDESGSEVVITIQEVQTCGRCGHERVVSENKEVTTLETPDETAAEATDDASEPTGDDGTIVGEGPPVEEAEAAAAAAGTEADLGAVETEPDDGVILEDGTADDEPDRDPGAWPEEPDDGGADWTPPTDVDEATDPAPDPGPRIEPTGEALTVPEGRFRCPSCGYTTPVESSSLREGDFCPECHTGSLAHERGED